MNSRASSDQQAVISVTRQLQLLLSTVLADDDRSYSLHEIAQATGLSVQTLAKLVNGQTHDPRLDTLRRLCQFYGISLDYFAGETEAECQLYLDRQQFVAAPALVQEIAWQVKALSARSQDNLQIILHWLEAERSALT